MQVVIFHHISCSNILTRYIDSMILLVLLPEEDEEYEEWYNEVKKEPDLYHLDIGGAWE